MARRTHHQRPAVTFAERLDLFIELAEKIGDSRVIQDGFRTGFNFRFDSNGLSFSIQQPDEESLRSFLVLFRPFLSEESPVFLNRIYSLLHQHVTDEELGGYLDSAHKAWKQTQQAKGIHFVVDGKEIQPFQAADTLINAGYFHPGDFERRQWLKQLPVPASGYTRYTFLSYIQEATRHVFYLRGRITYAREQGMLKAEPEG